MRSDDHVERMAVALIRDGVEVHIKPLADGWWRVRAKRRTSLNDPGPLAAIAQRTLLP